MPYNRGKCTLLEPFKVQQGDLDIFDAVIATGHQTVAATGHSKAERFYFIQGDERVLSSKAGDTWRAPLHRITVSTWLKALLDRVGYDVIGTVPNAVDTEDFWCYDPVSRRADEVVALYHRHPVKGPETLISALEHIHVDHPGTRFTVIAARPTSHRLPSWVQVLVRPSKQVMRDMFNRAAVCLHTSTVEGWGLVPMEAAACGCAVVSTASLGPREYLTDGQSMIEVDVGDSAALARATVSLLSDPSRRAELATRALEDVNRFSWEASTDEFERLLLANVHPR